MPSPRSTPGLSMVLLYTSHITVFFFRDYFFFHTLNNVIIYSSINSKWVHLKILEFWHRQVWMCACTPACKPANLDLWSYAKPQGTTWISLTKIKGGTILLRFLVAPGSEIHCRSRRVCPSKCCGCEVGYQKCRTMVPIPHWHMSRRRKRVGWQVPLCRASGQLSSVYSNTKYQIRKKDGDNIGIAKVKKPKG